MVSEHLDENAGVSAELKPDWAEASERLKAWWQGEILDRVPVLATAPKNLTRGVPEPPSLKDWWYNSDYAITRTQERIHATFWGGEAVPHFFPYLGSTCMTAMFGTCKDFRESTVWFEPLIENWSVPPKLTFTPESEFWQKINYLTRNAVQRAEDRYPVALTDLGGPGDILPLLRGQQELCVDLIEKPVMAKRALHQLLCAWMKMYDELSELLNRYQSGICTWLGIWSPGRQTTIAIDFSCMVSLTTYREFFLPEVVYQAKSGAHSLYHVDGPGALHHLGLLLDMTELDGIQWSPGAGQPGGTGALGILHWLPVMRRVQQAGKLLVICCRYEEVTEVVKNLRPEGLLFVTSCPSPIEVDRLLVNVGKMM